MSASSSTLITQEEREPQEPIGASLGKTNRVATKRRSKHHEEVQNWVESVAEVVEGGQRLDILSADDDDAVFGACDLLSWNPDAASRRKSCRD